MNLTQACRNLEQWLEQGEIEVATHRCGLDRLLATKPHGHQAMLNGDSEQGLDSGGVRTLCTGKRPSTPMPLQSDST